MPSVGTLPRAPASDSTDPVWSWEGHPRPVSLVSGAGTGRQGCPSDLLRPQQWLGPNACAHDHPPERLQGWHRPLPVPGAWVTGLEGQRVLQTRPENSGLVLGTGPPPLSSATSGASRGRVTRPVGGQVERAPPTCCVKLVIVDRVCALEKLRSASSPPCS